MVVPQTLDCFGGGWKNKRQVKRSVGVRDTSLSGDNTKLKRELAFRLLKSKQTLLCGEKAIAWA